MPSLMELVERVNKGEVIDSETLEVYEESNNSAEKFLAHHAHGMVDLRRAHQHMLQSLEAIEYSDQKVLNQFVSISGFLGLTELRAGPVVKFGTSAINRREYSLGVEAIQNAISFDLANGGTWTRDRENCLTVAAQYERVAQSVAWTPSESIAWNNKQLRIAYITSGVSDDDASAKLVASLARHHDGKRSKLFVYSTEASVRRERQQFAQNSYTLPSTKRGKETIDVLNRQKITTWIASGEGDVVAGAKELATQLVLDRIDVAIFDASQADPISAIAACWECAQVKVNLVRKTALFVSGISAVSYVDQARFDADRDFWQKRDVDARFLLEGIDLEEPLGPAPSRATFGIPEQAVVLATAGPELEKTVSGDFLDGVISILRAHPQAIYLLIGEGEMATQKRKFEAAGVSKRVGYTGRRKDLPGFLRVADVYLAEFPGAGTAGVLQAMAMEKPVVAMKCDASGEDCQAGLYAGNDATVTGNEPTAYIEQAGKLIRDGAARTKLGKSMKNRISQHFGAAQTARQLEQLCEQVLETQSDSPEASMDDDGEGHQPLAQVA